MPSTTSSSHFCEFRVFFCGKCMVLSREFSFPLLSTLLSCILMLKCLFQFFFWQSYIFAVLARPDYFFSNLEEYKTVVPLYMLNAPNNLMYAIFSKTMNKSDEYLLDTIGDNNKILTNAAP